MATAVLLAGLVSIRPAPAAEPGGAAPPAPTADAADSDPLHPIFLQFRDEYSNLPDGSWQNSFILRRDEIILKDRGLKQGRKGLLLRFDLPMTTVHRGADTDTGLGDLYAQALFFPRMTRTFAFGGGTGLYFPTASLDSTGSGKWSVAPMVVPIWFFSGGRGFALVKAQDVISLGGSSERPDLHFFLLTPTGVWKMGSRGWLLLDTEVREDWKNDLTFYKSGLQVGTRFGRGKAIWIKAEVPWGPDQPADWILKTSFYLIR